MEIDPRLQQLGAQLNPDHPYADPRVTVIIDDGRAFLERSDRRYDLIVFALPDSLTLVAGQSSLRLESYLFTSEAVAAARSHLRPGGVFTEYNYYREEWLIDRFAMMLEQEYGSAPCVDSLGSKLRLAVLTASADAAALKCDTRWQPTSAQVPAAAVDNHPFPYLQNDTIPSFYLLALGGILLLSTIAVRVTAGSPRRMRPYADLFFMGAAFLLLETKSIVQFALLFGTTWSVNALVFAGILVSVYLAIQVARVWRPRRIEWLYLVLLGALAVAWIVPLDALLRLDVLPRLVVATTIAFTPVFLANLVFAERFRDVDNSNLAFGANLLGAMVGGVLEYSALVIGYRSLLLVVAAIYGMAFLLGRAHLNLAPQART